VTCGFNSGGSLSAGGSAEDVRRLYEYQLGAEHSSQAARAFVELAGLIELRSIGPK
jgi:hypothetical protein